MILKVNEQQEEQPVEDTETADAQVSGQGPVNDGTPAAAGEDAAEVARDAAAHDEATDEENTDAEPAADEDAEDDENVEQPENAGEVAGDEAAASDQPAVAVETDEAAEETADVSAAEAPSHAEGDALELVQELEYTKPATSEKKSKKQDEDDEAAELTLTSVSEARAVLEGYLFSSNEPLSVQRLSKLMNNLHPRTVRGLVLELQMDYDNRSGALQIVEIAGGFQMATRPHLADWMFRMHRHKRRSALSPATLETLAIIAYKQPITKGEIEAIRGVESSGTVRTLQDLNMVEASGRREVVGRPQLFVTTEQFLKAFGLRSLADLPSISELRNLFASEQKLHAAVAQPKEEPNAAIAEQPALSDEPADVSMSSHEGEDEDEDVDGSEQEAVENSPEDSKADEHGDDHQSDDNDTDAADDSDDDADDEDENDTEDDESDDDGDDNGDDDDDTDIDRSDEDEPSKTAGASHSGVSSADPAETTHDKH